MWSWVAKEKRGFFLLCVFIIAVEVVLVTWVADFEHQHILQHPERHLVNNAVISGKTISKHLVRVSDHEEY